MSTHSIRRRLAAATPGKWSVWNDSDPEEKTRAIEAEEDVVIEPTPYLRAEDADLIANAPTDLAALVEVVDATQDLWWSRQDLSRMVERVNRLEEAFAKLEELP